MAIPTADLTGSHNPEWQVVARCIKNSSEESVQATEKTLNAPATNRQETSKKIPQKRFVKKKSGDKAQVDADPPSRSMELGGLNRSGSHLAAAALPDSWPAVHARTGNGE